jgi:hypothetical protein
MAIRAGRTQWTVSFTVGFADGYVAGESETEALAEEGCEREVIVAGIASRFGRDELHGTLRIGSHDVSELERKLKESTSVQAGARRDRDTPESKISARKEQSQILNLPEVELIREKQMFRRLRSNSW